MVEVEGEVELLQVRHRSIGAAVVIGACPRHSSPIDKALTETLATFWKEGRTSYLIFKTGVEGYVVSSFKTNSPIHMSEHQSGPRFAVRALGEVAAFELESRTSGVQAARDHPPVAAVLARGAGEARDVRCEVPSVGLRTGLKIPANTQQRCNFVGVVGERWAREYTSSPTLRSAHLLTAALGGSKAIA